MALRLPYVGIDPANRPDPPDMQAERMRALERDNERLQATVKAMESAVKVAAKVLGPYAAKAGGR